MARRELRLVANDNVIGSVALEDDGPVFERAAAEVFAELRRRYDDDTKLARLLLKDGWSNGYLYLAAEDQ